jgi:Histidine kinase-, DNA gyrase B-, and HSP90-like ATPase
MPSSDSHSSGGAPADGLPPAAEPEPTPFEGQIIVSSRIIDELSSGLYESPAACIKELINNAYDADATEVLLSVRPDADVIIVDDNGTGITRTEFQRHFDRIAESRKREQSDTTASGRPKIGRIGIGFIAANEICDRMDIVSTVAGSTEVLEVSIDFERMRIDPAERRRVSVTMAEGNNEDTDLAKADYEGLTIPTAEVDEHYTRVYLRKVRGHAQEVLSGAQEGRRRNSLYGLKPSSVKNRLADPNLRSWDEFDSYSRTMLEIALNVPVRYHYGWVPPEHEDEVRTFTDRAAALNFEVIADGTPLRKPTVLGPGPDGKSLLRRIEVSTEHVGATGYFYASSGKLSPSDLNGVLLRIRNAAVGKYDPSFLGYPSWESPLFSAWASCEIYADDRLEQALNIDRKTLRITDETYTELREALQAELRLCFAAVREELYRKRSARRQQERAREQSRQLGYLKDKLTPSLGEKSANDVVDKLRGQRPSGQADSASSDEDTEPSEIDVKALNTKYTVVEVIDIVATAAEGANLPRSQMQALLSEVARLLRG